MDLVTLQYSVGTMLMAGAIIPFAVLAFVGIMYYLIGR